MLHLKSCHCCGLVQTAPDGVGALCARCETTLESWLGRLAGNGLSAALAIAALLLYVPAITLPFLRIEQLGQHHESSLLVGVQTLFREGQTLVGLIVLLFSIVLPLCKLSALLFLSQRRWQLAERHRAMTYRIVEHLGRWGMLDVLLVAVMVAFIKLGGLVDFDAGIGLTTFTLFVLMSLLASTTFDPYCLWDDGMMLSGEGGVAMSHANAQPGDTSAKPKVSDKGLAESDAARTVPTAIVPGAKRRWGPYVVWAIPVIAAIVVAGVMYDAFVDRGRLINITFNEGRGIEAGDELRYHGIVAGVVESVALNDQLTGVTVDVRLTPESDALAADGSRFWIVRPQVDLTGIAGLETVVGSKYLTLIPGADGGSLTSSFSGLEQPPLEDLEFPGGVEIVLQSTQALGLRPGLGVFYRSIRIGGVISTGLATDVSAVETRIYIRPDYRHLIRRRTVFWNAGGIHVVGGLTELSVHVGTVETLIRGGIGVSIPPSAGDEVTDGARFELHERPEQDWLKWQPSVSNIRRPPPVDLPQLLPVVLTWTHDGFINSDRRRTGWVLPTESGLIGPRDLLALPADTIPHSATLTVNSEQIPLDGDVRERSPLIVERPLASSPFVTANRLTRIMTAPEDAFFVSDANVPPVFVAAARLTSRSDGNYELDPSLPITQHHHGGLLIATADNAIIGCVTIDGRAVIVSPLAE